MEIIQVKRAADQILNEERMRPTIQYEDVANDWVNRRQEMSPEEIAAWSKITSVPRKNLWAQRQERPRPATEFPQIFELRGINFDLLLSLYNSFDASGRPQLIDYMLQRVRSGGTGTCPKPKNHAFPTFAGKVCELPLLAEFCIRTGNAEPFFKATAVPRTPTNSLAIMMMQLEETIALNWNRFSNEQLGNVPVWLDHLGMFASLQTWGRRRPRGGSGPEEVNAAYVPGGEAEANQIVKSIDGIARECEQARYWYLRGNLHPTVNLPIESDNAKAKSFLTKPGFGNDLVELLNAAEKDYTSEGSDRKSESKEESGNMGLDLSSAEQVVLTALGEAYPQKVHLHQLKAKIVPPLERGALLRAVDALYSRSLIQCKPLNGAEGLEDAANIILSSEGTKWLKGAGSSKETPNVVTVLKVLIASPCDVMAERDAVESAIHEWSTNHYESRGIMLHPVRWETHSYPAIGGRPQAILNKQIVKSADFLIGIFGNRLGTPTGDASSGTIEEIEEIRKSGRHVALYFSNALVPQNVDRAQWEGVENYRRSLQSQGLYSTFGSVAELRQLVTQHLPKIVDEVRANMKSGNAGAVPRKPSSAAQQPMKHVPTTARRFVDELSTNDDLNPKEVELLWTAAKSSDGEIYHSSTLDGEGIRANKRHFLQGADARTASEWLSALRGMENRGLIEPLSDDRTFFKVTGEGYAAADKLEEFARWDAHSIILRAYYINADTQEIRLACQGIVALPATYYLDQTAADGSVQRSLKESRSLLVEGLGSMPRIDWQPTDVEFMDDATGMVETFRVDGMQYIRPGRLKLPIISA